MKYTFTILFFLIGLFAFSQDEYTILNENFNWIQETSSSDGYRLDTTIYTEFRVMSDTLIQEETYKKLYGNELYYGALQEVDKRLLYYANEQIDTLLDFNLVVGDTVFLRPNCPECEYMILESIDITEPLLDDSSRKRMNFIGYGGGYGEQEEYHLSWIDGIGSTRGFIPNLFCFVKNSGPICIEQLACHGDEGDLVYTNVELAAPFCEPKQIVSVEEAVKLEYHISIFPNPSNEYIQIAWNPNTRWRIRLFDQLGSTLYQSEWIRNDEYYLSLQQQKRGFYWLEISTEKARIVRKVIKME